MFDKYQVSNALREEQAGIGYLDTPERKSFTTRCTGLILPPQQISAFMRRTALKMPYRGWDGVGAAVNEVKAYGQ